MPARFIASALLVFALTTSTSLAQAPFDLAAYIRQNYVKQAYKIAMRDGVRLYTIVYAPKEVEQKFPIMMTRTPYGVAPYEPDAFRSSLGPNSEFPVEKYIFVYQDVRGRFMSEGTFENMRPQLGKKAGPSAIDE